MRCVHLCAIGLLTVLIAETQAQFPFMNGFMENMANMVGNLQNMGQTIRQESMRRANAAGAFPSDLRPGEGRYINNGNTRGYVYRSPNGGFSSYLFSSGGPSSGFVYHSGPNGSYYRAW